MSDPTRGVPVAGGPPPPGPPPSTPLPPGPGDEDPDRRLLYAIAGLIGVIVLLVVVLLLVRGGDDSDTVATGSSTTTSTPTSTSTSSTTTPDSSSSTTSSTTTESSTTTPGGSLPTTSTTEASTTTTTTEPPATIAPRRCQGRTGPSDPDTVAMTFYDAWTVNDRACAEKFATEEAIDTLFAIDGSEAQWEFQECAIDQQTPDRDTVCSFRYEGGTALFSLHRVPIDGWELYDVDFRAD